MGRILRSVDHAPGESGTFAFKLAVHDHVIVRTNEATYAENGSLKADYFDEFKPYLSWEARRRRR